MKQLGLVVVGDEPDGGHSHPGRSTARDAPARPLVASELWSQWRRREEGRFEGQQTARVQCPLRRRKNPSLLCSGLAVPEWCTRTPRRRRTRRWWARGRLAARVRQPSLWGGATERARVTVALALARVDSVVRGEAFARAGCPRAGYQANLAPALRPRRRWGGRVHRIRTMAVARVSTFGFVVRGKRATALQALRSPHQEQ